MYNEKMEKVYEEDERDREVQIKETNADISGIFKSKQAKAQEDKRKYGRDEQLITDTINNTS